MGSCYSAPNSGKTISHVTNISHVKTYIVNYSVYEQVDHIVGDTNYGKHYVEFTYSRLTAEDALPEDNWDQYVDEWKFSFENREDYKSQFTIYSGVKFEKDITIRNTKIPQKFGYAKLIMHPTTNNFVILNIDMSPIYLVLSNKLTQITTDIITNVPDKLLKEHGFTEVINHCACIHS